MTYAKVGEVIDQNSRRSVFTVVLREACERPKGLDAIRTLLIHAQKLGPEPADLKDAALPSEAITIGF